jgi:hypothetical protein
LGEHNEYVYKEVTGVSDEEYAELDEVVQELQRELLNQLKPLYLARKLRSRDHLMRGW